jgi:hypothetical protein
MISKEIRREEVVKESLKGSLEARVEIGLIDTKTRNSREANPKGKVNYW